MKSNLYTKLIPALLLAATMAHAQQPVTLQSEADKADAKAFAEACPGQQPAARQQARPVIGQPNDDTVYRFRGYNTAAGLAEDGQTQIGGIVAFNLKDAAGKLKFQCDTIASSDDFSPYSIVTDSYFYSYRPIYTQQVITQAEITRFDKQTLQQVGEKVRVASDREKGIPYRAIAYDPVNRQAYAFSMGTTVDRVQPYYLNIVDTVSGKLRRIGEIAQYNGNDGERNVNPGSMFTYGGELYAVLRGANRPGLWIARVNPLDATYEFVGLLDVPDKAAFDQPVCYDPADGVFYLNYYNMEEGTIYYSFTPQALLHPENGQVAVTRLMNVPTGYTWFYVNPETLSAAQQSLAEVTDFTAASNNEGTQLSLALTTPAAGGATGNLTVKLFVDNVETATSGLPATVGYGQQLQFSAATTPGLHRVRVDLQPTDAGFATQRATALMVAGKDVPAAVTNAKVTLSKANVATITWTAPTTGRYQDFGGEYDASAPLTYRVVRNQDGAVIADGVTARRVQDQTLPEELAYYDYTIVALQNGREGAPAVSPQITAGNYMAMPYDNNLDSYNQVLGWSIINANNDSTNATWQWNNNYGWFYGQNGHTNSRNDDWLISPPFRMEAGKLYEMRVTLSGASNLDVFLGTDRTVASMTQLAEALLPDHKMDKEEHSFYVRPAEDGTYHFGLHDYINGEYNWVVDNVRVNEVAPVSAPAQAANVVYNAAPQGALSATIALTAPATDIKGDALASLQAINVYDDQMQLLGSLSDVQPGQQVQVPVKAVQGFNYVRVVAANAEGNGWPVQVRAFAGHDLPVMDQVKMTWSDEDEGSVTLTYSVKPTGENGGYIDPASLKYTIYQHFDQYPMYRPVATDITDTEIDVEMVDPSRTGQAQYIMAVSATSIQGEGAYKPVGVVLGKPYTLPYKEVFGQSGLAHQPYVTIDGNDHEVGWALDADYYNYSVKAQNNDGVSLILLNNGEQPGQASFETPIIDLTKATEPLFRLWVYDLPGAKEGGYVTIDYTTDGANITALGDTVRLGQGNGWREVAFNLKPVVGHRAQLLLTGYMPDAAARIWADNWSIGEARGNDLAVTGISRPYATKHGNEHSIDVTVSNIGGTAASDYSVLFTLNGEVIAEAESEGELLPGQQATMSFPLTVSSISAETVYSAELLYDDDNQDNNLSAEVELQPEQTNLPAPSMLAVSGDQLSWQAPATIDGMETTLDFENMPTFDKSDELAGWLNIDGDQHKTTYFMMLYNNFWPHKGSPLAFMTWGAAESGNPTAAMWTQHQGNHCLIHFGHFDITDDGYPISDDDDWFISPEIKGGTPFSFWTLSNDAQTRLEVRTSSTDRKPESFTQLISNVSYSTTAQWKQVTVTLPNDARYVALHIPYDGFGTMIDEISYTAAVQPVLQQYNVYRGTELVGNAADTNAIAENDGTYRVTALYDLGESMPSNDVARTLGIEATGLSPLTTLHYYDLQGRRVTKGTKGLSIVRSADGKAHKVIVK